MSCEDYVVGQRPRFSAQFRLGSTLTDPTTLKFIYKKPTASSPTVLVYGVDAELVRESTGKYHVDLLLDVAGLWKWRYESSGIVDSAQQDSFHVAAEAPIG
jgi:hypothetical protein